MPANETMSAGQLVRCGCGGMAELIWWAGERHYVRCMRIRCGIKIIGFTREEAIERWNLAMGSALREAAQRLVDKARKVCELREVNIRLEIDALEDALKGATP